MEIGQTDMLVARGGSAWPGNGRQFLPTESLPRDRTIEATNAARFPNRRPLTEFTTHLNESMTNGVRDLVSRAVKEGIVSHVEVQVLQTISLALQPTLSWEKIDWAVASLIEINPRSSVSRR